MTSSILRERQDQLDACIGCHACKCHSTIAVLFESSAKALPPTLLRVMFPTPNLSEIASLPPSTNRSSIRVIGAVGLLLLPTHRIHPVPRDQDRTANHKQGTPPQAS
jgi:hypothetical protein